MKWWTGGALEAVPDWKLDRLAIRLALFGRERLGLEPGERVVVMGRLGWLWPALDFAAMGFGVVPVGLEHDLSDDAVAFAFAEAAPRAAFATDAESAARLKRLRAAGRLGGATVVGEGLGEEEGVLAPRPGDGPGGHPRHPGAGPGLPRVLAPGRPREPRPVARRARRASSA